MNFISFYTSFQRNLMFETKAPSFRSKVAFEVSHKKCFEMSSENQSLLGMLKPLMLVTGTWKLEKTNSSIYWFYWSYTCIYHGIGLMFAFLLTIKFIQFVGTGADSEDIISSQVYLLTVPPILIKIFIYQASKVPDIFKSILEEEEKLWLSRDRQLISEYQNEIKHVRKWNWGILLSSTFTAVALMSAGVASLIQWDDYLVNSEGKEKEEWSMFPIWLPYNERQHKTLAVVSKCIFTLVGGLMFAVTCMMFVALMLYSVMLLKTQHIKIRKCDWPSYDMEDPFNDLKDIIVSHRHVIGFIREVNKSIRYVVLVDVLLNSINIASLATYLTTVRSGESLFSVSYLLVQIMQVFVLGLLANEIKIQSQATADVLCSLNWHHLDTKSLKNFLMMLMQCQQIAVISIGPFGPMSIDSVISVIKAAYSYMMLMQSYK